MIDRRDVLGGSSADCAPTRAAHGTGNQTSTPTIDHFCVADRLKRAGVPLAESNEEDVLRVRDPNGLMIEMLISRT